jgi:glyceraldehyde 3-phosphate dehydrogenase
MGRLALRAGWDRQDLEFTHINEIAGGPEAAAHLLLFDSVHGRWHRAVRADGGLSIEGRSISFSAYPSPGEVPWAKHGIEVVLECSGQFRTVESMQPYFAAASRK